MQRYIGAAAVADQDDTTANPVAAAVVAGCSPAGRVRTDAVASSSSSPSKVVAQSVGLGVATGTPRRDVGFCPTREEVIAYGGVANPELLGVRSSERLRAQPNVHLPQPERAMLMAARRDSMERTGTSPNPCCSFVSFSNEQIGRAHV